MENKHSEKGWIINMAKRLVSTFAGLIVLLLVMISKDILVFNFALSVISVIAVHEFYCAFKNVGVKPFFLIGYIVSILLFFVNEKFIWGDNLKLLLICGFPIVILVLFSYCVFSKMKFNVNDIIVTIFGVVYVPFLFLFLTLTRQLIGGEYLIWYVFGGAWITDTFAFLIGCKFGKHKLTEISPKKSVEGSIAGIVFCAIFYVVYSMYLKNIGVFTFNYLAMILIGAFISIISQIGDLSASAIKRYCKIKDFGKIMPGHGGILDRFDSIIMISPLVYFIFQFII